MAKKKTVSTRKTTTSARKTTTVRKATASTRKTPAPRKTTASARKTTASVRKTTASVRKTQLPAIRAAADILPPEKASGAHEQTINLLTPSLMEGLLIEVNALMDEFTEMADNNLTALQRRRKIGPGVRNYGFIDKASDLAEANPDFAQFFKITDLKNCLRNIEMCRDLILALQGFARAVTNTLMIYSDDAYSMSLLFYGNLRGLSRRGDPRAMELFRALQIYFHRKRRESAEPTIRGTERDVHAILKGTKDGKIIIESQGPVISAGVRKIVDDVRRGKAKIKESAEAEADN